MTNWELGNEIMCSVADKMRDLSDECRLSHPQTSDFLKYLAIDLGPISNQLTGVGLCPEPEDRFTYIDTSKIIHL